MQRTLVVMLCLVFALAATAAIAQDGHFPNAVYVVAEEGVFPRSAATKDISPEDASEAVAAFLASAGAISIEQVFHNFDPADTLSVDKAGNTVRLINLATYYRIEFADSVWWGDLRDAWNGDSSFRVVGQAGYFLADEVIPNDPLFNLQYHLESYSPNSGYPMISEAWEYTTGSPDVKIGIIDGGFDLDHEDLSSRIASTYRAASGGSDADPATATEDHGTHVAGIAGAVTNNGIGVSGVNWQSPLYLARAGEYYSLSSLAQGVFFRDDYAGDCIDWLRNQDVDIQNMSFGYTDDLWSEAFKDFFFGNVMAASCYNAWASDILLVASKGNDASTGTHRPSDYRTVMGIGSCDLRGVRVPSSNYGAGLDVNTLGQGVYSTLLNNTYGSKSGTSMAAPIAAGVASLLKSYRPDLTADEIEQIIETTAKDRGDPGWDAQNGWGTIRADSALWLLATHPLFRLNTSGHTRQLVEGQHQHHFVNEGSPGQGLTAGTYFVETWRCVHHFDFPEYDFIEPPTVLIRHRGSMGWSGENPNPMFPWAGVVEGSLTSTGCDIETYAYFVKFNLLGQYIGKWYPCNANDCVAGPDIDYQITLAGRPAVESPATLNVRSYGIADNEQQYIEVKWQDPNYWELGWVVERRTVGSSEWDARDTLPPNSDDEVVYLDTSFVGSETYVYRVKALSLGADVPYSPEAVVFAVPHWPRNLTGTVVKMSPAVAYRQAAKVSGPGDPAEDTVVGVYTTTSAVLSWSPPENQKLPIDHYIIKQTDIWNPWAPVMYECDSLSIVICDLLPSTMHFFEIGAVDINGKFSSYSYDRLSMFAGWLDYCPTTHTDDPVLEKREDKAAETEFYASYPNPFNTSTTISFSLAEPSETKVAIYNALGQEVAVLVNEMLPAGSHQIQWTGTNGAGNTVASGMYFVRFTSGNFSHVQKLMLIK